MTSENASLFSRALRVDDLSVGRLRLDQDWTGYTPVFTGFTLDPATPIKFRYRIIGRTIEVQGYIGPQTAAGGVNGAIPYSFSLPSGALVSLTGSGLGGQAFVAETSGPTQYIGVAVRLSTSTIGIILGDSSALQGSVITYGINAVTPAAIRVTSTSNLTIGFKFSLELLSSSPILQQ